MRIESLPSCKVQRVTEEQLQTVLNDAFLRGHTPLYVGPAVGGGTAEYLVVLVVPAAPPFGGGTTGATKPS